MFGKKRRRRISEELHAIRQQLHEIRQLVGPFGSLVSDGVMLTQTLHGQRYLVDADDDIITPEIVTRRQWEPDVSGLMYSVLGRNSVFVDVGANFGYFTCLAAAIIGDREKGKVYAFEPNPGLAGLLRRNVGINWSGAPVDVVEAAVTEIPGEVTLYVPRGRGANASLSVAGSPPQDTDRIAVRATSLDQQLPGVVVDVLKVDVEGHELGVLLGAKAMIERSPSLKIVMEWSPGQMTSAGVNPGDIRDFLSERGFVPFRIAGGPDPLGAENAIDWQEVLRSGYMNVLLARH